MITIFKLLNTTLQSIIIIVMLLCFIALVASVIYVTARRHFKVKVGDKELEIEDEPEEKHDEVKPI
jgi:cbb3-type cytochrome oxidase subunit 3